MEVSRINPEEWEYYGEGGSSTSYVNKLNGNIVLKLNNKDIPFETTEEEYLASKSFFEMGLPAPAIYGLVTDGERFGYTGQRIKGKLSFARTLSQEPDMVEDLAKRFARQALELHRTPADVTKMKDARGILLEKMGNIPSIPADVLESVKKCFSSIVETATILHGDMNPGNLITFEGRDSWIGVNELIYGDPFLDIATMHILCYFIPGKTVSHLYHTDQSRLKTFYKAFLKAYFGEEWESEKIMKHIRDAAIVKFCAMVAGKPEYLNLLVPLVRGQKVRFMIRRLMF